MVRRFPETVEIKDSKFSKFLPCFKWKGFLGISELIDDKIAVTMDISTLEKVAAIVDAAREIHNNYCPRTFINLQKALWELDE